MLEYIEVERGKKTLVKNESIEEIKVCSEYDKILVGVDLSKHNISWVMLGVNEDNKIQGILKRSYHEKPSAKHIRELNRQIAIHKKLNSSNKTIVAIEYAELTSSIRTEYTLFKNFLLSEVELVSYIPDTWRLILFNEKRSVRENTFNLSATKTPAIEYAFSTLGINFWTMAITNTKCKKGVFKHQGIKKRIDIDLIEAYCIAKTLYKESIKKY